MKTEKKTTTNFGGLPVRPKPGRFRSMAGVVAFAAVLAGLFLGTGCESDDDAPEPQNSPVAEEDIPAGSAYDNESVTVFTGRVMSEVGGGIGGVNVTWSPVQYNSGDSTLNTDTSVSVSSDTTGPDGFFAVSVGWDRDYGYGAIAGRIVITRPGYPAQETATIGPTTASSYSIGELYPGWMP
ncbi:MAG: hypothetical protein ACOX5G_01640 [Kiritimatiellia bacterium]|jgi:hypothetical protein